MHVAFLVAIGLQSAYSVTLRRPAMLKVISDALLTADLNEVTLLCLLDLAAPSIMTSSLTYCSQRLTFMAQSCHRYDHSSRIERKRLLSLEQGRIHLMSSSMCYKVAFLVRRYFFYRLLRLLPSSIDAVLVCTRMLTSHSLTSLERLKSLNHRCLNYNH